MQQFKESHTTWYFAIGSPQKTSLCSQFCRENDFIHFKDPKIEDLSKNSSKHAIIEGSLDLFRQIEKVKPDLSLIIVGKPATDQQKHLCEQYEKIGRLKKSSTYKYQEFRKKLFPNIVFIYGPVSMQNKSVAHNLSTNIGYCYTELVKDANEYISHANKCVDQVVNGLFEDPKQIRIMSEYFEIRVIHLKYNRVDIPNSGDYFDKQFQLVSFLKDKSYYIGVQANGATEAKILDQIGTKLCPRLIFVNANNQQQKEYLEMYIQDSGSLLLNFQQMQDINKRKRLPLPNNLQSKTLYLSSIFYRDLNRKEIVLSYYPWLLEQVLAIENLNRKIDAYVELSQLSNYQYSKTYTTPFYFKQNQKFIHPTHHHIPLKDVLRSKVDYWLIAGPAGSGKTSLSKYLVSEFGFKHIEFEPYLASVKEKLIAPEDGQELPVRKAIEHFRQLLTNDKASIYVIDGLPYVGKDLQAWISAVGIPRIINLQVETPQQIKRCRRKAQSDLAAEVTQEESNKAKQSNQKNIAWIENISTLVPAEIYKVDYNDPQIKVEGAIKRILKPRIFLVQKNSTNLYQNIAIKYDLGFVNLNKTRLRQCQEQVRKCTGRDIILCNHGHEKKRIASQDLYWIEKNLGQIRYLGIWENQQKQHHQEKLHLQRPKSPEKPKAAEGQPAQEKPPEDPPAEGEANKKKFDIYDYEWSKPGDYKNLSQWFYKSKHHITEIQSTPEQCYNEFKRVLDRLNESAQSNVYQKIK